MIAHCVGVSNNTPLVCLKSEKGLYLAFEQQNSYGRTPLPASYRWNGGVSLENTFKSGWHLLRGENELTIVERCVKGAQVNHRWVLRNEDVYVEGKIPKEISCEDAKEYRDEDCDWCFGNYSEFYPVSGLYHRIYDTEEDYWEELPFTVKDLGTIESNLVDNFADATYTVSKSSLGARNPITNNISSVSRYSELEQMMTPDLLLHNRPCTLNSESTYKIIRYYVLDNLDGKYASVTSDYDFCFTVQKRYAIKPETTRKEIKKDNGRSYAKPRYNVNTVKFKNSKVFEMTHKGSNYKGYTPIEGFSGDNLQDLIENIKLFLDELMDVINRPVKECECCNGTGHILEEQVETNKREVIK